MAAAKLLTSLERETIRRLCAAGLRDQQIADALGRERSCISRHRRKMGIARTITTPDLPPASFTDAARTMTAPEIAKHFGVGIRRVRKWLKITGQMPCRARQSRSRRVRVVSHPQAPTDALVAFLRSRIANVHRCDIIVTERPRRTWGELRNMPDKGAGHWFLAGIGICDRERMVKLADEMGFSTHLNLQAEQA